jgi:hypothetical protein
VGERVVAACCGARAWGAAAVRSSLCRVDGRDQAGAADALSAVLVGARARGDLTRSCAWGGFPRDRSGDRPQPHHVLPLTIVSNVQASFEWPAVGEALRASSGSLANAVRRSRSPQILRAPA